MTYAFLPFGSARPTGWLAARMRRDLDGFIGQLDALVPELIVEDDIYGRDRLTSSVNAKDVGAILHTDDAAAREQFLWWNSETQSNWRDGWIRHALLVGTDVERSVARAYVDRMLSTADADGYLGIYGPGLRFPTAGENGELWAQATMGRALIAYIEGAEDRRHGARVLDALRRSVDLTLSSYAAKGTVFPSDSGGGGSHGLMFVDVLDALARLTGEVDYLVAAARLYAEYSGSGNTENDAALPALLQTEVPFAGHGVHTYEHLRAIVIATEQGDASASAGLEAYLRKLAQCLTPAGGPIGDEWLRGRAANASSTGYEFCSIVEYIDSLIRLMAATGDLRWADDVERSCFNAGFGSWHPTLPAIAYLQTDNAIAMTGNRFGARPDPTQTRYRYSPVHREAAVCCVPNAGRLLPTYLRGAVMVDAGGLVIALYAPLQVTAEVAGFPVTIAMDTEYPYGQRVLITVTPAAPVHFTLTLRRPAWADHVRVAAPEGIDVTELPDRIELTGEWHASVIDVHFASSPRVVRTQGETHVEYGPLVYALPIPSRCTVTREYALPGFVDVSEEPTDDEHADLELEVGAASDIEVTARGLLVPLRRRSDGALVRRIFTPLGNSALRRVTFAAVLDA